MTEQVLPQVELTVPTSLGPEDIMSGALLGYRDDVARAAAAEIAAAPGADWTPELVAGFLMEYFNGHSAKLRWLIGAAFRHTVTQTHGRILVPVKARVAARRADKEAEEFISYFQATSGNAVIDLMNIYLNHKVPSSTAASKAIRAFGLTGPQARTLGNLAERPMIHSTHPGAWKSHEADYIRRAFGQRLGVLVPNALRQVEQDVIQDAWSAGIVDGTISALAQKRWYTATDERTCPVCAPMDEVMVSVDDTFELPDGNKIKTPPVHPNCRCTLELVLPEDISKAWKPQEHPRTRTGEFTTKNKPRPGLNLDQRSDRLRLSDSILGGPTLTQPEGLTETQGLRAQGGLTAQAGLQQHQSLLAESDQSLAAASGLNTLKQLNLGGQQVSLLSLDMLRQAKVAGTLNAIEAAQRTAPLEPGLEDVTVRHIGFGVWDDLRAEDYSSDGSHGKMHPTKPIRFVPVDDELAVRAAVNQAMQPLAEHLKYYGVSGEMAEVASGDPDLADRLWKDAQRAGYHGNYDDLTFSVEPEDAVASWRNILLQDAGQYPVVVKDARDRVVGTAMADSSVIAQLSDNQSKRVSELVPKAIVAPNGSWGTDSGVGATTRPARNSTSLDVTGPFDWERRKGGIIQITPDTASAGWSGDRFPPDFE